MCNSFICWWCQSQFHYFSNSWNKDSIKKTRFIGTIIAIVCLNINKKLDSKWWYAFDIKIAFYPEINRLTKFSYEFYWNFAKTYFPKNIKNCAKVLSEREIF